jgi:peroxiredoxin Q/BCP
MTEAVRLQRGDAAPDFSLPTDTGKQLSLKNLRGPGCTTQACDFRDNIASLRGAGYEVVGISPDSPAQAYGEKQMYGRTVVGVIRSTFVIDQQGRIEKAMYNVKATGHVAKLRRELGLD